LYVSLQLLKGERLPGDIVVTTPAKDEEGTLSIRCPLCGWRPSASSRWSCDSVDGPEPPFDSCGTVWNTFSTRGTCPGCGHQWKWTSCLRCHEWSPHDDWYEKADGHP
jgi:hypothetical protein